MNKRTLIYLSFIFILLLLLLFFLNYKASQNIEYIKSNFYKSEMQTLREFAENIDRVIKSEIGKDDIYTILYQKEDIRDELEKILSVIVSKRYKYAYVVQKRDKTDGVYRILLDGSLEEKAQFCEPFNVVNSAWDNVYVTKKPTAFSDNAIKSIWMTYLYPVLRDNKVEAIIAIEFSKRQIEDTLEYVVPIHKFIEAVIFVLLGSIFFLFIFMLMWFRKDRESRQHKQDLEKNMLSLEKALVKAQASERSKSEFLANMSHEIRTPLNAVIGFISLLKEESFGNKKLHEYMEIIDTSSNTLLQVIEDILDFSKIESGKLEIDKHNFNPKEELELLIHLFDAKLSEKNLNLHLHIDKNIPNCIYTDPFRVKQIISNLMSNAIKFTPRGKNIYVNISYKKEHLCIEVKDEGIGIKKEKQEHIFEAFNQEDSSTTRKYGGTGLGLSISKKLVNLLGGHIHLESEIGKGSLFSFCIPAKEILNNEHQESNIDISKFSNNKILLVEDNKANQVYMKVLFKKLGLDYSIANDGREAVSMYIENHNKYDAVLMDENMPHLNGIEATKMILEYEQKNHLLHLPIIALTANAIKGDRERFLEAGMDEYLSKPVSKEKLSKVLRKFL